MLRNMHLIERCRTFKELERQISESIDIYNRYRPHLSLNMETPEEVHEKASMESILA
ncbi:integrase core domain-containing protein [Marinomonas polaris]